MKYRHAALIAFCTSCTIEGLPNYSVRVDEQQDEVVVDDEQQDEVVVDDVESTPPPPPNTQKNTRLELRTASFVGGDGSVLESMKFMHDSTLNEDCLFKTASDGNYRCIPMRVGAISLVCSQDVVTVPCGFDVPNYATRYVTSSDYCMQYMQVYNVGAEVPDSELDGCRVEGIRYFYLGSEVSPAKFVAGDYVIE